MIVSALIAQLRREYHDVAKSSLAQKYGDSQTTLFNIGKYPIIEGSHDVMEGTSARTNNVHYSLDLDNGDLQFLLFVPAASSNIVTTFKYANWRDKNWVEAINQSIEDLNGRGFFRQIVRNPDLFTISAGVTRYNAPSACIDVYEILESDNTTISGNFKPINVNWQYQQDANQIVFGQKPVAGNRAVISYLRNLQTYDATSATLDVKNDWLEALKKKAGAIYFRAMASKIALEGNANIDEGHFSFTNLRTQANDLENDFIGFAKRKKPTRPAKDIMYHMETGGSA